MKFVRELFWLIVALCWNASYINAIVYGSYDVPSRESRPPALQDGDILRGFAFFYQGFELQDAAQVVTWDCYMPVGGTISLNGGGLDLMGDFSLVSDASFSSTSIDMPNGGTIYGNGYPVLLPDVVNQYDLNGTFTFVDTKLFLRSPMALNGTFVFSGDCIIEGTNNVLTVTGATIIIDAGSHLSLKDITVKGVNEAGISCVDNDGLLVLDDVRWIQDGNVTFNSGAINFVNNVEFIGSYTFSYESPCTSVIDAHSSWAITEQMVLDIGRNDGNEPLAMTDLTSALKFSASTWHVHSPGMLVDKGRIEISRDVTIDVDSTSTANGLIFGDGITTDALCFEILAGCSVSFPRGHIVYDVVDNNWIVSRSLTSRFIRDAESYFYIKQDLVFPNVTITSDILAEMIVADGKTVYWDNCIFSQDDGEYKVDAKRYDRFSYLLDGNKYIFINRGNFIASILVSGQGNKLQGGGTVGGLINVLDPAAELIMDFNGIINYSIDLNGGTLTLAQDCSLMNGASLVNDGVINLATSSMICGYNDAIDWVGSYTWQGTGGCLILNSNINLQGDWIFDGDCMLNGNDGTIDLSNGEIVVAEDTTLVMQNVKIKGISQNKIHCLGDNSKIILDDVTWFIDGNYSFSTGSFDIIDNVEFNGTCTFTYESAQAFTIKSKASLTVSNLRFEFGPSVGAPLSQCMVFEDQSSNIVIDNCAIFFSSDGFLATKGVVTVSRDVVMEIDSTSTANGLVMGDGTPEGDMILEFSSGASINFLCGHVTYNITSGEGIKARSRFTKLHRHPNTFFYIKQSLVFTDIILEDDKGIGFAADPGVMLKYNNATLRFNDGETQGEYLVNCYSFGGGDLLFLGDHSVWLDKRSLPVASYVAGTGNRIAGDGSILKPITLLASDAEIRIGIGGFLEGGINLNGGTLILDAALNCGQPFGPGTVDLSYYRMNFCPVSIDWVGSIDWKGNDANLTFNANVSLSTTWTFTGVCSICGNGNVLNLGNGNIIIKDNSQLTLKDIVIKGILDDSIVCMNESSSLILDNVVWIQDADYTFSTGSLQFKNKVKMKGLGKTFTYCSDQVSTIHEYSTLSLNSGITLSYASTTARDLLSFVDETSVLSLFKANLHSRVPGLQLKKGTLIIDGECFVNNDATGPTDGIWLGDGVDPANNITYKPLAESGFVIQSGYLVYNNVE